MGDLDALHDPAPATSGRANPADRGSRWPWIIVALTPAILAIATWDTLSRRTPVQDWLRGTGLLVTIVEIVFVAYALRLNFEPLRMIRAWPAWVRLALIILIVTAFCSALFVAPDPAVAMLRSLASLVHLLFGMSVAHLAGSDARWTMSQLWPWVATGSVAYVLILVLFVAVIPSPDTFNWKHLGLAVTNVRQTAFYSTVGAAAALGCLSFVKRTRDYVAIVTVVALMFGLAFWSGTRSALVAIWVAFPAALLVFPALRTFRALGAIVGATAAGLLVSLIYNAPNPHYGILRIGHSVASNNADELSGGRLGMWSEAWRLILESPFIGFGEGQYGAVTARFQDFAHPHNAILQVLLQWGFVGGACSFLLIGALAYRCFVKISDRRPEYAAPFMLAASLLTMSMYEGSLYHAYPIMMLSLALGIVVGQREEPCRS